MSSRAAAAALVSLSLSLGLLAPACGASSHGGSAATTPPTSAVAGEALATYVRDGGLAGRRFQVVVRPDGSFEGGTAKPGRGRLGAAAVEDLRGLVAAFAAAAPAPTYGTANLDGFTTTSVSAGGASTSVMSKAEPPAAVSRLVSFLAALERQLPR